MLRSLAILAFAMTLLSGAARGAAGQESSGKPDDVIQRDPPLLHVVPRSGDVLKDAVTAALRESRRDEYDAKYLVPELASLFRELAIDDALPLAERTELQHMVRYKMIDVGIRVMNDFERADRERKRQEKIAAAAERKNGDAKNGEAKSKDGSGDADASLSDKLRGNAKESNAKQKDAQGGNAEQDAAQELIDLITSTIAPDSWDIVGGPGSIYYFSLTKSLVVHQTSELHRLIRGLR